MKKIITVTLCIVLVLLFAGCGKNGDTSKVEIDYGASSVYSKEEIDSAIEIIKKQFASFEGCELHSLSYMSDEECNNTDNIEWMNDLRTDDNQALRNVLHLKVVSVHRKKVVVHGRLTKNTLGHGGLHGVKVENGI
ncbi:MAG: hypothetical protein V8S96_02460 [Lachnospiraceae bacterium]